MTLEFVNAEKRIHDSLIFPSFNLTVNKGQVVAVYSSVNVREQLIHLLLGKTLLSHGEIRFDENLKQPSRTGFLFLHHGLYERLSIAEMLQFTKRLHGSKASLDDILRMVQLDGKRSVKIKQLSYSEKKRVQLACLLIQDPAIFVLEEPDQNIDLESKRIYLSTLQHLREAGKVVFILTGNLESAVTSADTVFQLDDNGLRSIQMKADEDEETADPSGAVGSTQPVRFEKIPTKVNEKIVLFNPPEIDYIESNEGQTFLHIKGESFSCVFTLTELEERLLPFGFFRCHRSYIVNLQKVREVVTWTRNSYSLVLEDISKSTIPLSKSKMVELKEMLGLK
ncbi:LytTR family transcriptional regulator DNA-binding domain-containing protein [Sporosarcina cyprini]|uniref:LytTR family transcriptional regulator DNA-binding domain-containing protein n=1 Tax=Sporosarcina cyprini TaxID=2910523 RepID=UPI001EDEC097|nr:LytTR family transcriptional regulator DNA-binding domain-containing protein [Sporosarcina cyprini]MCG3087144.1 LytTR family transcriptional regulator DNA-binding domain-containing protein [Sporosarcina cyprini]